MSAIYQEENPHLFGIHLPPARAGMLRTHISALHYYILTIKQLLICITLHTVISGFVMAQRGGGSGWWWWRRREREGGRGGIGSRFTFSAVN